jgi:hypothetical protein
MNEVVDRVGDENAVGPDDGIGNLPEYANDDEDESKYKRCCFGVHVHDFPLLEIVWASLRSFRESGQVESLWIKPVVAFEFT